jgi:thiamine-monophosphate kinase
LASDDLSEFDLIARLFEPLSRGHQGALGLLDDAAILPPLNDQERIVTTDCLVCDVHFRREDPPESVASKALGVNLSDLAAMGATPEAYTLALSIPRGCENTWLEAFAGHLQIVQDNYGISLIGGDTVSTPGPMTISITAIGKCAHGSALKRSTAQPGDDIYVSGTIGDAALGLKVLQETLSAATDISLDQLSERYQYPQARTKLGQALSETNTSQINLSNTNNASLIRACCDISDGLIADLAHICTASECQAEIDTDLIPLSASAQELLLQDAPLIETILFGGDDYELIFTTAPDNEALIQKLSLQTQTQITRIGRITQPNDDKKTVILAGSYTDYLSSSEQNGFIHSW